MKSPGLFIALCAGVVLSGTMVLAQEAPEGADPMAAMMEMLKPTPHHLVMKTHAGEWATASTA